MFLCVCLNSRSKWIPLLKGRYIPRFIHDLIGIPKEKGSNWIKNPQVYMLLLDTLGGMFI